MNSIHDRCIHICCFLRVCTIEVMVFSCLLCDVWFYGFTRILATVILSWCLSRPSTVARPDEIEISGFHCMIA